MGLRAPVADAVSAASLFQYPTLTSAGIGASNFGARLTYAGWGFAPPQNHTTVCAQRQANHTAIHRDPRLYPTLSKPKHESPENYHAQRIGVKTAHPQSSTLRI